MHTPPCFSCSNGPARMHVCTDSRQHVQAMRQQEVLYQADFRLVMLKRSLARAGGQRTDNEAAALHARIAELSATLDGRNAERALFLAQIKRTEQDLGASPLPAILSLSASASLHHALLGNCLLD